MTEPLKVQQRSIQEIIDGYFKDGLGIDNIMDRFRNSLVVRALELNDGNITKAAALCKAHRTSFVRWMKEAGIDRHYAVTEDDDERDHSTTTDPK